MRLDALNVTLKGYSREDVLRLTRELPDAIARQMARRDPAPERLADRVARQVADRLLGRRED
ncbi:MAG: hypothetical protein AB7H90_12225 [Alphaproteobacteria bacterium]